MPKGDWERKLNNALWAYETTFKMPIYISLYRMILRQVFHFTAYHKH